MTRVAYVTGGTQGMGHMMRGLAIRRALQRAGFAGEMMLAGPPLQLSGVDTGPYRAIDMLPRELNNGASARASALAGELRAFCPDLLIVDLFWGIGRYLIDELGCDAWLLVRASPPWWLSCWSDISFPSDLYDRVVLIEPWPCPIPCERIAPVVIANPDDCRAPNALAEALGAARRPLSVVLSSGTDADVRILQRASPPDALWISPDMPSPLFPIAEWMLGADAVLCGCGYNAYWEAQWLGYKARTSFFPFRRSIDNQAWRLTAGESYTMTVNGADTLASWIVTG